VINQNDRPTASGIAIELARVVLAILASSDVRVVPT